MTGHERIYLEPEDGSDPDTGRMWCQHPAPGAGDDRTWTEYVRADLVATQVAAAQAAGAEAVQTQIAEWISRVRDFCISQRDAAQDKATEDLFDAIARDRKVILDGIAIMPLPTPDALARAIAAAEARGLEKAAARVEALSDHEGSPAQVFADLIRAAAKERQA